MSKELIQLKTKDLPALREKLYKDCNGICPILKIPMEITNTAIDHLHKLKEELPDESGKGCCRGLLHLTANSFEGKVLSDYKRLGLSKVLPLPELLRNLADYLENNILSEQILYIHPSEKPRELKMSKGSYNKLVKAINGKQKVPKYTGKLTKELESLFTKYSVDILFNKH